MRYYPLNVWKEDGTFIANFPDEQRLNGVTQAESEEELAEMAEDLLITTVEMLFEFNQPIPDPLPIKPNQPTVKMSSLLTVKVLLHNEMIKQRITKAELARLMNVPAQEVQRILKPRHNTKLDTLSRALGVLGKTLSINLA
ncbi:type II toxin-antitoxin system HicB family antitoxin [Histophilus somni]|uniref:type II toxin-antitoxin system HicB family antitoxin n=1 Tax=Histophilus somni TaxID=731 RepID=UPI00094B3D70|nr:type II toxin-antitoxin system HicB family antitoxin [Histophilus somni]TDF37803.1 type II toxin-antitoxin system HicB family antitoxin [Histophilus somni]TFF02196.1 type II toxin-antitoxin system HicB family antitoxin [Histophilus somni]TJY52860.1 type II toxin-antitoxin system HicB family antitoxin [Histophilus somni]